MKRNREGRTARLHPVAQAAIAAWLKDMPQPWGAETYLFRSREGANRPLQRVQAWQILHDAYVSNQLQGHLGTHSMRKTFAARLYAKSGDLVKVQTLLGHADLTSTGKYFQSASAEDLDALVLSL
jgi:site-specific recombinase XerD